MVLAGGAVTGTTEARLLREGRDLAALRRMVTSGIGEARVPRVVDILYHESFIPMPCVVWFDDIGMGIFYEIGGRVSGSRDAMLRAIDRTGNELFGPPK